MLNWPLLSHSLFVSAAAALGSMVLGLAAALACLGLPGPWRRVFLSGALVALAIPPFLTVNCWIDLFGWTGRARSVLPWNIYSFGGTIWLLILSFWPVSCLACSAGWSRLEREPFDAEPALTGVPLFVHLLWPLAATGFLQSFLLVFVLCLNQFAIPAILQVKVFPAELWVRFNTTFKIGEAWLLSWPMVLVPLLLLLAIQRKQIAWPVFSGQSGEVRSDYFRARLGAVLFLTAFLVGLGALFLSAGLPILHLAASLETWPQLHVAFATARTAFANSFLYAGGGALLALSLGTALARWRLPALAWIFFFLPGILLPVTLINLVNRSTVAFLYPTTGLLVAVLGLRFLGWGHAGARRAFQGVDQDLLDEARLAGASPWQLFRWIYLPLTARPLLLTAYLVYLLALWDTETVLFLVPPGGESLALRIFNLLHYGHNPQVNALCLLLLGLAAAPLVIWRFLSAARWQRIGVSALLLGFSMTGCRQQQAQVPSSSLFAGVEIIGSRGTGPGQFNKPRSVTVDAEDNLYVADMTARVQKFSATGTFLGSWQLTETDLGKPKGMARDHQGNIIVVEPHYARLNHFSTAGALVCRWGAKGTNHGQLFFPRAAAVNSRGEIYVSEYGVVERVQRFAPSGGECLGLFGRAGAGQGEFNRAEGLAVDGGDQVYVADSCNHRIQIFTPEGVFVRAYGRPGAGPGELNYPYDVCVDREGRQYVCEFGNSRVQIFDVHDQPLETLGGPGLAPGQLHNPWSVALDSSGNLYVADSLNHRVQKFIRRRA